MDIYMYRCLIFITAFIGGASSHYEETYNGHSFILPTYEEMQRPLELTFSQAREWCKSNLAGSALPRIIEERDSLLQFIQSVVSRLDGQTLLVNGIKHTLGNWSWINGHDVKDIEVNLVWGDGEVKLYNYGYLWTEGDYSIQASRPEGTRNYICEFANISTCRSDMLINRKCYRKRNVRVTWFQARNSCLTENGDLASFETLNSTTLKVSLQNVILDGSKDYWIGLQRNLLHLDDKGSEIKFVNLTNGHRSDISDKCMCLSVSKELRWIECNCENSYPFICTRKALVLETNDSLTSSTTIKTTTSNQMTSSINLPSTHSVIVSKSIDQPSTTSAIVSSPMIPLTAALSTVISSNDQPLPNNAHAVIGAVVSCVIIVIIIIIVVVVVVIIIRKHRNRPVNSSRYVTSESNMTTANEFPVYAPVQEPRENQSAKNCSASNTVYATIEPDEKTNEESQANNIVYAELDLLPPRP